MLRWFGFPLTPCAFAALFELPSPGSLAPHPCSLPSGSSIPSFLRGLSVLGAPSSACAISVAYASDVRLSLVAFPPFAGSSTPQVSPRMSITPVLSTPSSILGPSPSLPCLLGVHAVQGAMAWMPSAERLPYGKQSVHRTSYCRLAGR